MHEQDYLTLAALQISVVYASPQSAEYEKSSSGGLTMRKGDGGGREAALARTEHECLLFIISK